MGIKVWESWIQKAAGSKSFTKKVKKKSLTVQGPLTTVNIENSIINNINTSIIYIHFKGRRENVKNTESEVSFMHLFFPSLLNSSSHYPRDDLSNRETCYTTKLPTLIQQIFAEPSPYQALR